MTSNQQIWQTWSQALHRLGVYHLAVTLLEAAGPLTIFGAQIIYLCQPVLKGTVSMTGLNALAAMLEDPQEAQAFARFLIESPRGV